MAIQIFNFIKPLYKVKFNTIAEMLQELTIPNQLISQAGNLKLHAKTKTK